MNMDKFRKPDETYKIHQIVHSYLDDGSAAANSDKLVSEGGYGGIVTNPAWTKEFVDDEDNLKSFGKLVDKYVSDGLTVWLYDDTYYPSGWANGKDIKLHPEHRGINVSPECKKLKKGEKGEIFLPDNGYYFVGGAFVDSEGYVSINVQKDVVSYSANEDGILVGYYVRQNNPAHYKPCKFEELTGGYREHPDFLSKSATQGYINSTVKIMLDYVKKGEIEAVFTDEPSLNCFYYADYNNNYEQSFDGIPWTLNFKELFYEKYGIDITERLTELFIGNGEREQLFRIKFYSFVGTLFANNFIRPYAEYCKSRKTVLSGHFLLEEIINYHVAYYGDYMKVAAEMGYPGFDILTGDYKSFFSPRNAFGANWMLAGKFPSSAARLNGHNHTMVEICPVMYIEDYNRNPVEYFKKLVTCCVFVGATHINSYASPWTSPDSENKTGGFGALKEISTYAGRMIYLLRNAKSDCRNAVLYPINDSQALHRNEDLDCSLFCHDAFSVSNTLEDVALKILKSQSDFNILTEDALEKAEIKDGILTVSGTQYETVILPDIKIIRDSALKKLDEFEQSGGKVIYINNSPKITTDGDKLKPKKAISLENLASDLAEMSVSFIGNDVFVSKYLTDDNKEMYFLINPSTEDETILVNGTGEFYLLSPEYGTTDEINLPANIDVKSGMGLFILKK